MPPGNACTKPPVKVIERISVEACLAIAQKVQHARELVGDEAGSEAAGQVARVIQEELLRVGVGTRRPGLPRRNPERLDPEK